MEVDWASEIRDQCKVRPEYPSSSSSSGRSPKAGGRELDGETWDEMPVDADDRAMVTV